MDILVARTSAVFRTPDGNLHRLRKGRTTVRAGHEILRGREHFFEPLAITYDVPIEAQAPVEKPKASKPKSPAKKAAAAVKKAAGGKRAASKRKAG